VQGNKRATGGSSLHTFALPTQPGEENASMTIRLADCDGHRNRANMLLSRMYSWRGYGDAIRLPSDPNCITFTATNHDEVIGTLTLGIDSPAGLAIDRTFKDEVDRFRRAPGAKLCELTKFAFDTSSPARPRLAALFHLIFIYGSMHYGCTDLLIEINPRHRRFYEVMLGFRRVGEVRTNAAVDAPSQLMWINVADIRRYIDKHTAEGVTDGRSLYPHFFSEREEQGIYNRLAGLAEEGRTTETILSMTIRDRIRLFRALGQEVGASLSKLLRRPMQQPAVMSASTTAL
jgi:hypothetical protein